MSPVCEYFLLLLCACVLSVTVIHACPVCRPVAVYIAHWCSSGRQERGGGDTRVRQEVEVAEELSKYSQSMEDLWHVSRLH